MSKTNKKNFHEEEKLRDPKRQHEHREVRRGIKRILEGILTGEYDEEIEFSEKEKI